MKASPGSTFGLCFVLSLAGLTALGFSSGCGSSDGSNKVVLPGDAGTITLSVEPASATRPVGQTQEFEGIATASDGASANVTRLVSWTSSRPDVATIDGETGVATALSAGSVVITASRDGVVATAKFTVTSPSTVDASTDASNPSRPDAAPPRVDASTDGSTEASLDASSPPGRDAEADGGPGPAPDASTPATRIFVSNLGGEGIPPSVRMFAVDADGDAAPVAMLEGSNTRLSGPSQMAVKGDELFVANGEGRGILVFDVRKSGNVAPIRAITGSNTTFSNFSPMGLALHGGSIFVSDQSKGILVFPEDGTGDIAPTRAGASFIYGAHVSNSSVANEILVAVPSPSSEVRGYLDTATANDAPLRVLSPGRAWTRGVVTTTTGIFVVTAGLVGATLDDAITVFAHDAKTGAPPLRAIAGLSNTGLSNPHGIGVHGGEIYVSNQDEHAVRIFDADADGDVQPRRVIKGVATGLRFPAGLLVATVGG